MNYTQAHELFRQHGIIFTLAVDPEVLPFGHIAQFASVTGGFTAVCVPPKIKSLRSETTHIHPDVLTGQIWEALKQSHLVVLCIGSPSTIIQVQEDNTLRVTSSNQQ